jgi:hypothetical protein
VSGIRKAENVVGEGAAVGGVFVSEECVLKAPQKPAEREERGGDERGGLFAGENGVDYLRRKEDVRECVREKVWERVCESV